MTWSAMKASTQDEETHAALWEIHRVLSEIRDQLLILNKKLEANRLPPAKNPPRFTTSTTEGEELV